MKSWRASLVRLVEGRELGLMERDERGVHAADELIRRRSPARISRSPAGRRASGSLTATWSGFSSAVAFGFHAPAIARPRRSGPGRRDRRGQLVDEGLVRVVVLHRASNLGELGRAIRRASDGDLGGPDDAIAEDVDGLEQASTTTPSFVGSATGTTATASWRRRIEALTDGAAPLEAERRERGEELLADDLHAGQHRVVWRRVRNRAIEVVEDGEEALEDPGAQEQSSCRSLSRCRRSFASSSSASAVRSVSTSSSFTPQT